MRNRLTTHLGPCARIYSQSTYSLANFPYEEALNRIVLALGPGFRPIIIIINVMAIILYIMSAPYAAVANYTHNKHGTLVLTHTLSLSLLLVCVAA